MSKDSNLTNLKYVLADLYPFKENSYSIVQDAGLPLWQINWQNQGIDNWSEILREATNQEKVKDIIQAALKRHPKNPFLLSAFAGTLTPAQDLVSEDLSWENTETIDTLEALTGKQSTFLPVHWLELGTQCARSVAKVVRADQKYGTGFLTKNNLFITNHHVLSTIDEARMACLYFNFQNSADGLGHELTKIEFDPDNGFKTSEQNDWTCIRVKGDANIDWGAIPLRPVDITRGQRANIIQHPGGLEKQIAIYNNRVTDVQTTHVRYLTDTLTGSSGSPVFDDNWHLIALHYQAGGITAIGPKHYVYPNKGINIHCFLKDVEQMI
jgi:Trypsin-like peptidase domain/Effector-associated domain 1